MKKKKKYYAFVAGFCVMLAGALFLCGRSESALGTDGVVVMQQRSETGAQPETAREPQTLIVHVCGAVRREGVYELEAGSRVEDAVRAAGGFLPTADRTHHNLAKPVADGEQIRIPTQTEAQSLQAEARQKSDGLIDINTAGAEELEKLPGIGAAKAQAIIAWREENGRFETIEDIMKVPGIKESAFSQLKDRIKTGE